MRIGRSATVGADGADGAKDTKEQNRLVQQVSGTIVGVGAGVLSLGRASDRLKDIADSTAEQAHTVAVASEQTSQMIDTVASGAEELSGSLSEVSGRMAETSTVIQRVVADARQARELMAALDRSGRAIGGVADMIAKIANQTNLLALNASIEAARAGESGAGFAVVAGEVKDLSRQTAAATSEIGQSIARLVEDTGRAREAITAISELVDGVGQMSEAVAAAVEEQTATTAEIARSVTEAATTTSDVARAIGSVSQSSEQASEAAQHIGRVTRRLREEAETLNLGLQHYIEGVPPAPVQVGTDLESNLKVALQAHGAWKARLMEAVLTGHSEAEPSTVALDDKCPFGVWLYQGSDRRHRESPFYEQIRRLHGGFHELAGRILGQAVAGRRREALTAVRFGGEFDLISAELVTAINSWRDEDEGC